MAAWVPKAQETLLIPHGAADFHLFVVLNDPLQVDGYPGAMCALVNVTTLYPNIPHDDACVLTAGCHPFVVHDSYIAYRHARLEPASDLIARVTQGVWQIRQPMGDPPFSTIKAGLQSSKFTKRFLKTLPL